MADEAASSATSVAIATPVNYQARLIREYDKLAEESGFVTVDARRSVEEIQDELRLNIARYLQSGRENREAAPKLYRVPIGAKP